MANEQLTTEISFVVDQAELNKAKAATAAVDKGLKNVAKGFKGIDSKAFKNAISDTDKLRTELVAATKAQEALNKEREKTPTSKRNIAEAAGSASTALSQLGSGVSALGGGSGLNELGDLVGSIEALKGAGAAVSALGVGAGGLSAAIIPLLPILIPLAAAAAVAGLAFKAVQGESEKAAKQLEREIEARKEFNKAVVGGATQDELLKQFGDLNRARDLEIQRLDELQQQYQRDFASSPISALQRLGDYAEETLVEKINEAKTNLETFNTDIGLLEQSFGSAEIAANGLANALNSSVDAQRSIIEAIVGGATSAQAQDTIDKLQQRIALEGDLLKSLEEQRLAYEATSPQFAALTEQITQSKQSLLDAQAQVTSYTTAIRDNAFAAADAAVKETALQAAREKEAKESEDFQKKRAEDRKKRADDEKAKELDRVKVVEDGMKAARAAQDKYSEAVANAQKAYSEAVIDAKRSLSNSLKDLGTSLARDFDKLSVDYSRQQIEVIRDQQRADIDARKDLARSIEDINEQALQSEEDARSSRNILAIADIRKAQKRQTSEAVKGDVRAAQDRQVEFERTRLDNAVAYEQQRTDRLSQYAQQQQDAQLAFQRDLEQANIARIRAITNARQAYSQEMADLSSHLSNKLNLTRSFYAAEVSIINAYRASVRNSSAGSQRADGGSGGSGGGGGRRAGDGDNSKRRGTSIPKQVNDVLKRSGYA